MLGGMDSEAPQVLASFARDYQSGKADPGRSRACGLKRGIGVSGAPAYVGQQKRLQRRCPTRSTTANPQDVDPDAIAAADTAKYTLFAAAGGGTHMYASFGHLAGVLLRLPTPTCGTKSSPKDFFEQFDSKNLLGRRYARCAIGETVLEPGGSASANDLVKNFLGRPTVYGGIAALDGRGNFDAENTFEGAAGAPHIAACQANSAPLPQGGAKMRPASITGGLRNMANFPSKQRRLPGHSSGRAARRVPSRAPTLILVGGHPRISSWSSWALFESGPRRVRSRSFMLGFNWFSDSRRLHADRVGWPSRTAQTSSSIGIAVTSPTGRTWLREATDLRASPLHRRRKGSRRDR